MDRSPSFQRPDAAHSSRRSRTEQRAASIGTGVQVLLVCSGVVLFVAGIALSFGGVGMTDLLGGPGEEPEPSGDDVDDGIIDESGDDSGAGEDTDEVDRDDDDEESGHDTQDEVDDDSGQDDGETDDRPSDDSSDANESDDTGDDETEDNSGDEGDDENDEDNETVQEPPTIETHAASDVDDSSATIHGELTDLGDYEELEVFFQWRSAGAEEWNETGSTSVSSPVTLQSTLEGLSGDTTYEFRAVADPDGGEVVYGDIREFSTDDPPRDTEVETLSASDVEETSATLNGNLTELGGSNQAVVYFKWRTEGTDEWNTTDEQQVSETGPFNENVSDLDEDTEYEFRAIVETEDGGIESGEILSFTTEEAEDDDDDDDDDDDGDDDDDDDDGGILPFRRLS